jgi:hypothetical protein
VFGNDKQKQAARNTYQQSLELVANAAAGMFAVIATPWCYERSVGWIKGYISAAYSPDFADLGAFVWGALLAILLFGLSRMTIATAIIMGGLALVSRFAF